MKILNVKTYSILSPDQTNLTTKDLIVHCLKITPEDGLTMEEVVNRVKIQKLLENDSNVINIEDSDVLILKRIVKNSKWGLYHNDLADFANEVLNL